jgi:hypothetical protein
MWSHNDARLVVLDRPYWGLNACTLVEAATVGGGELGRRAAT